MPDAANVMDSLVKEELTHLSVRSFDELVKLPSYTTKQVVRDGHEFALTIYHDSIASTEHRIVVQVIKQGWLGFSYRVHVDGFILTSPTERRELTDEERWQYE